MFILQSKANLELKFSVHQQKICISLSTQKMVESLTFVLDKGGQNAN